MVRYHGKDFDAAREQLTAVAMKQMSKCLPSFKSCTLMSINDPSLDNGGGTQAEKLTVFAGARMTSKFANPTLVTPQDMTTHMGDRHYQGEPVLLYVTL